MNHKNQLISRRDMLKRSGVAAAAILNEYLVKSGFSHKKAQKDFRRTQMKRGTVETIDVEDLSDFTRVPEPESKTVTKN
jgi:hypothetical protein